jgi:hypothetical protein
MKLIIAGTRNLNQDEIHAFLNSKDSPIQKEWVSQVISGNSGGVDRAGEAWAKEHNISLLLYPAKWSTYGKAAGPLRNALMAKEGDALLAIWDGKSSGTKNMIEAMKKQGKEVRLVLYVGKI